MDTLTQLTSLVLTDLGDGVSILEQRRDPSAFGSGWVVIGRGRPQLRLVWDGKERRAFLQAADASGGWFDRAGPVAADDVATGGAPFRALIEAARAALARP